MPTPAGGPSTGVHAGLQLETTRGATRVLRLPDLFEEFACSGAFGAAPAVLKALRANGHECCFVGGCVRDAFLRRVQGRELPREPDFDLATSASVEEVGRLFDKVVFVGAQFGVSRVIMDGHTIEVAQFRTDEGIADGRHPLRVKKADMRSDSARRDFTINALYFDPETGRLFDFQSGVEDLTGRLLRFIGEPGERIREDHLRILRAIRFACTLNFSVERRTWEAICANAKLSATVSGERVSAELKKMLESPARVECVRMLSDSGVMKVILPEVEAMKGVDQPREFHPEGDVYIHTLLALKFLPPNASFEVALATLLHDVGKPGKFRIAERIRFDGHAELGATMTEEICRRLKLPAKTIEKVVWLVAHHMRYTIIRRMRKGRALNFLSHEHGRASLEMYKSDVLSSFKDLTAYDYCVELLDSVEKRPEPFVKGEDVIRMGLREGPAIGRVLEASYMNQLEGKYADREAALNDLPRIVQLVSKGEARDDEL